MGWGLGSLSSQGGQKEASNRKEGVKNLTYPPHNMILSALPVNSIMWDTRTNGELC